jgi:hypothetical protein
MIRYPLSPVRWVYDNGHLGYIYCVYDITLLLISYIFDNGHLGYI